MTRVYFIDLASEDIDSMSRCEVYLEQRTDTTERGET